jgi:hypothetical protein
MDTTALMKIELLRMKHARALCSMRVASNLIRDAKTADSIGVACDMGRDAESLAKQAEADLEKLIAESQPVTEN